MITALYVIAGLLFVSAVRLAWVDATEADRIERALDAANGDSR